MVTPNSHLHLPRLSHDLLVCSPQYEAVGICPNGDNAAVCISSDVNRSLIERNDRYVRHSRQFMDAYHHGLNGKQAAWALRKYCGHRALPATLMDDLLNAKI